MKNTLNIINSHIKKYNTNMEDITISEDIETNSIFWSELIRSIYDSFDIQYVINKRKKYMNCSNEWYDADELREKFEQDGIKIAHKDHECNSYFDDCNVKSKINKRTVKLDEIKYVFDGKFTFDEDRFDDEWEELEELEEERVLKKSEEVKKIKKSKKSKNDKNVKNNENDLRTKIKNLLLEIENVNKNIDITNIKFICNKKIKILNKRGINKDHRGSDHMLIKLPFEKEVCLEKEFTLEDLIIRLITIKSHKFDLWYELYCCSKCEIIEDELVINTSFDHGS